MKKPAPDICVLTVIPPELDAMLSALNISLPSGQKLESGSIFWKGKVRSRPARRDYSVVVGCMARAGNQDSAIMAAEFLNAFRPSFVMLVGIAAGMKEKIQIGNVAISTTVVSYEPGVVRGGESAPVIQHRPTAIPLYHGISQDVTAYLASASVAGRAAKIFLKIYPDGFPTPAPGAEDDFRKYVARDIKVREGVIASGEKLLRDAQFLPTLKREIHEKIEVGEMEAAGLVSACTRAGVPWLVVRGISDFGDSFKDDRFHAFAASAAAGIAVDFLRYGLDLRLHEAAVPNGSKAAAKKDADRVEAAAGNRQQISPAPSADADERPSKVAHNLPRPDYEAFVGRSDQIADIMNRLRPYPKSLFSLICIDGPGGIGKSALALRTGYKYIEEYYKLPEEERFERIIWTSAKINYLDAGGIKPRLRSARNLPDILRSICTSIGKMDILKDYSSNTIDLVYEALSRERTLLIIDNLETVNDSDVESFIRELAAPTKVILTSRQRVDMAYPVRLDGLALEDWESLIRHHSDVRNIKLSDEDMLNLYKATGGVPLAAYWALGLVYRGEPLENVLERLKDPDTDIARFCFEEIVKQIRDTARYKVLMATACFMQDASAEGVSATADLTQSVCDGAIGALEAMSLINRAKRPDNRNDRRFYLLPLTRTFAQGELARQPDVQQAYFIRFLRFLKTICRRTQGPYYWRYGTYELYDEGQNVLGALDVAYTMGTADDVFWAANAACDYLDYVGDWHGLIDICKEVLGYAESISDQRAMGNFNSTIGWYLLHQNRLDEAESHLLIALKCYKAAGDLEGECVVQHRLSACKRKQLEFQEAERCCARALAIAEQLESGDLRALVNLEWGKLDRDQHNWDAASSRFSQVRAWFESRATQTPTDEVLARSVWGHLSAVTLGRYYDGENPSEEHLNEAKTLCLKSLDFFADHGGKSYFATLKFRLAEICYVLGERSESCGYAEEAREWFKKLGMSKDLESVEVFLREKCETLK